MFETIARKMFGLGELVEERTVNGAGADLKVSLWTRDDGGFKATLMFENAGETSIYPLTVGNLDTLIDALERMRGEAV